MFRVTIGLKIALWVFLLIVSITINQIHGLGSGPHPFVKAPRPGDSEATPAVPESSRHLPHQSNHPQAEATLPSAHPRTQQANPNTNLQSPLVWLDQDYIQPVHTKLEVVKFLWKWKHVEERSWKRKRTLTFWGTGSGSIFHKTWDRNVEAVKFLWKRKH